MSRSIWGSSMSIGFRVVALSSSSGGGGQVPEQSTSSPRKRLLVLALANRSTPSV
ncbi:MAG: hypothetical protein ACK42H_02105 [Planctomycetota bacterium]